MSRGRRAAFQTTDVLKKLEIGRKAATTVKAGSQPFKDRYNKARAVSEAIDDLVEDLTGDWGWFRGKPHG